MKDSIIIDKLKSIFKYGVILLFWIGVWQLAHLGIGRDVYVPSPFVVFERLFQLIGEKGFWRIVYHSMARVAMGVSLSLVLGVTLGVLSGLFKWIYALFHPFMVVVKSTPVISIIIVALVWLKSSNVPIFISFLMCFPIIWTNTVTGIQNVDNKLLQMAKVYAVTKRHRLKYIYIPSLVPYISAAMITALGLGWKVSVAAEVLSHPRNAIGSELHTSKAYVDTPSLFAWTLVVILLSLMFEFVFAYFIKKWTIKRR